MCYNIPLKITDLGRVYAASKAARLRTEGYRIYGRQVPSFVVVAHPPRRLFRSFVVASALRSVQVALQHNPTHASISAVSGRVRCGVLFVFVFVFHFVLCTLYFWMFPLRFSAHHQNTRHFGKQPRLPPKIGLFAPFLADDFPAFRDYEGSATNLFFRMRLEPFDSSLDGFA